MEDIQKKISLLVISSGFYVIQFLHGQLTGNIRKIQKQMEKLLEFFLLMPSFNGIFFVDRFRHLDERAEERGHIIAIPKHLIFKYKNSD